MQSNKKEMITLWQFFVLITLFNMGGSVIIGQAYEAGQDAWIAVIVSGVIGTAIMLLYYYLIKYSNEKNYYLLMKKAVGKWAAKFLIFLYILYFFYSSGVVIRDLGELMVSSIFVNTPLEVFCVTLTLTIAYMLKLGIEILSRTTEIFFPYFAIFIIFVGLGVLFSGNMEFENLLPIMPEGIQPIIKSVFPSMITFPYGELIVFTMLFQHAGRKKQLAKVVAFGVFISFLLLCYSTLIQIMTLGSDMRVRSNFPLLNVAREISLLNFIERVDLLIVFVMMLGVIVKAGVLFYGGLLGVQHIANISYRKFVLPMSMIVAFISVFVADTYVEHIEEGLKVIPLLLNVPFQFIIPFCLFLLLMIKKIKKKVGAN
ncbi:GerAB/ArcD/ProY family transporter [Metabacillus fastidiosus]|uniref:GerAB/ArcD/ProY family transporter n=1 Tax=Metabacillus fastidiosus TaxID=1458 RepID=UPI002E1B457C|nr:GerAB/ArcD/ProY family transporter [Metabacillus fastidiosus]MED4532079.1 GerAB/ArcD/ProY family transporter [Metabacillus fastidiosus]